MDDAQLSLRAALRRALESDTIATWRELYTVELAGHAPTGFTVHGRAGEILPTPASLAIAKNETEQGFYLFYLDDAGAKMTDTYHQDLGSAFAQANAEFGVSRGHWTRKENDEP